MLNLGGEGELSSGEDLPRRALYLSFEVEAKLGRSGRASLCRSDTDYGDFLLRGNLDWSGSPPAQVGSA